jgi:hypothetical protein
VLRGLAAVLISAAVLFAASLPLYVFPPQSAPRPADVVFVIGPPEQWRVGWARQLIAKGQAKALMISAIDPAKDPNCKKKTSYPVLCRRVAPFTTRGEARWLKFEMELHGWNRALIITTTPHVVRARLIMDRCVPHGVQVVGRSTGLSFGRWVAQYRYQTGAFLKALFITNTC